MRFCRKIGLMAMVLLMAVFMNGCGSNFWNMPVPSLDTVAPTVGSTSPDNLATNVAINNKITATFSEVMNPATINTSTFTLKQGTTVIASTVTYVGLAATLRPASNFAANTIYTVTVTTGVTDLAGNALAVNKIWSFTTGAAADTTPPTVSSTIPINLATGVTINSGVTATFSEPMDPATIDTTTFTLKQGTTSIPCTVTYIGLVATLKPTSNLTASTSYTATITTGAKDLAGNALAANKTWSFTTGATADTTAPTVGSTFPINLSTGVALNINITATFSEAMNPETINTTSFILMQGSTAVGGTVTYTGLVATFTPTSNLASNTIYDATITTTVKDLGGNALAVNKTWRFTTSAVLDTTPPIVNSVYPTADATGVALNASVTAAFSEAMKSSTINTTTFTLKQGATVIDGDVTYADNVATFNPISNLTAGTTYTAKISTGVTDLAGNALVVNKTWSFTTGTVEALGPAQVNLGTAGDFVILSKSGISTTGVTKIYGNIGVSPMDQTGMTGFSETMDSSNTFSTSIYVSAPGAFVASSGKLYAADYTPPTPDKMTTAISNMETAYTDAAGRTNPTATELGAGEIGGMTLAPGLYKWGTGLNISTDLYLSGASNDVWIFEVAQDLTLANGIQVHLTGGAQAKNVFWQIAGSTTLGTTSVMYGNILCQTLIAMNNGATLVGRLLSQTAVTLNAVTVTLP